MGDGRVDFQGFAGDAPARKPAARRAPRKAADGTDKPKTKTTVKRTRKVAKPAGDDGKAKE